MKTTMIQTSSVEKVEAWIYAICLLFSIPPFFFWSVSSPYFMMVCLLISLKHFRINRDTGYVVFTTLLFLIYLVLAFMGGGTFVGTVVTSLMGIVFFTDPRFLKLVFDKFVYVFSITSLLSVIQYILVVVFDIGMPYRVINALNTLKSYDYMAYAFFVMPSKTFDILPRFFGMYDEPGVVGTIAGAILMTRQFNFKKWINIPIFIAGILSFSLFFYVIFAIYVILFAKIRYKVITTVLVALAVYLWRENEILERYVFSRLEIENGEWTGDDRTKAHFDYWYKTEFVNSKDFYFGLGRSANTLYNQGGASYKDVIVNYGIIFFVIYMGTFTLFGLYRLKFSKEFFIYFFLLYGVIYQRPFIGSFVYLFIIFIPILYLNRYIGGSTRQLPVTEHVN